MSQPAFEQSEHTVPLAGLLPLLGRLEESGAFGMTLRWGKDAVGVTAWRGKEGPCHETGRSATYDGPCLAVGDDDHHFVAGTIRVCEKTGRVYASKAYARHLRVSEADPALASRLEVDPVPFDCDTLADDAAAIAGRVAERPAPAETPVVYLGPFRYVVLADGAVLRRGIPAGVSRDAAELLVARGYAAAPALAAPPAPAFPELYRRYGPLFLVGRGAGRSPIRMPDFSALQGLSVSTRDRLAKTLDRGDDYFMLQGTDPSSGGCCPLPQVGESNRLVAAGVLDSWASPLSPDCPVTAYTLAGEIGELVDGMPRFRRNELLRRTVRVLLEEGSPG